MTDTIKTEKTKISKDLIKIIESKYSKDTPLCTNENKKIKIGDIVRISYSIPEGEKERIQGYEGLIIAIQNKGLGKSFTLRRMVQGIGIEQVFLANSPKIISIAIKQSSKVRRAKLYFMRFLTGKSTRLKRKFD
jgi:large subunit ribosomal protein L19